VSSLAEAPFTALPRNFPSPPSACLSFYASPGGCAGVFSFGHFAPLKKRLKSGQELVLYAPRPHSTVSSSSQDVAALFTGLRPGCPRGIFISAPIRCVVCSLTLAWMSRLRPIKLWSRALSAIKCRAEGSSTYFTALRRRRSYRLAGINPLVVVDRYAAFSISVSSFSP